MKVMKKKFAVAAAAALVACSIALTGCQSKLAPADQVVGAMYDLSVKENATPMKDLLGFASEEDVKSSIMAKDESNVVDMFKDQFTGLGVDFTDDEIQGMSDTMLGLLAKLSYTAEITEESSKETTVVLKVHSYAMADLSTIMTDIMTGMQENMDEETLAALQSGDPAAQQKVMSDAIKQYMAKIGEMEPSEETTDITVKCEKMKVDVSGKEKVSWMPSDMDKFSSDMENTIFK